MAHEMPAREGLPSLPRVLLIDDDREALDLYKLGLEAEGYAVRAVFEGETGLALCRSWRPDVILLDMQLSNIGGHELLSQLQAWPHDTAPLVVALSNYTKAEVTSADPGLIRSLPWLLKLEMTPQAVARWIRQRLVEREDTDTAATPRQ